MPGFPVQGVLQEQVGEGPPPLAAELRAELEEHCLLIGRPRAPSSPTAREMPRGVAVASIARLPSSTDDPSGSTADRHHKREKGEAREQCKSRRRAASAATRRKVPCFWCAHLPAIIQPLCMRNAISEPAPLDFQGGAAGGCLAARSCRLSCEEGAERKRGSLMWSRVETICVCLINESRRRPAGGKTTLSAKQKEENAALPPAEAAPRGGGDGIGGATGIGRLTYLST